MGFFSWLTADTNKSIANCHSTRKTKTVYLLQPNGANPIMEDEYDGYGDFGSVDAYTWVADTNMPEMKDKSEEYRRTLGMCLDMGELYLDERTGQHFSFHYHILSDRIFPFEGNYGTVQPDYGKTPNELVEDGTWKEIPGRGFFMGDREWFPIKLSFKKTAKYEDLEASKSCPAQGFFY